MDIFEQALPKPTARGLTAAELRQWCRQNWPKMNGAERAIFVHTLSEAAALTAIKEE